MRFGFCAPIEHAQALQKIGFDYIEPTVVQTLAPDEPEEAVLTLVRETLAGTSIEPQAFNVFLPGDLRVTGPHVDKARQDGYLRAAVLRARALGGEIIVFGSGRARQVPEGFSFDQAKEQVIDFLKRAAPLAKEQGITIALEPLSARECNFITSVAEGMEIVRAVNHPAVAVLSDLYHVTDQGQPYSETKEAGAALRHVHVAGNEGRRAPVAADIDFLAEYFAVLKAIGYQGRVSVEGHWSDIERDGSAALDSLQKAWQIA